MTAKQRHPNFVYGFVRNINAVQWLWDKLNNEFGYENLSTNHLCQDPNENLFSEVRRRCGRNDSPNAVQFAAALKSATIAANEKIQGSNCESDNAVPLCDFNDMELEDLWEMEEYSPHFKYKLRPLKSANSNFTNKELNGLTYILGATVVKLSHSKCRQRLTTDRENLDKNDRVYCFSTLKNASCYPSTLLFEIGLQAFTAYKQKFRKFLYQNRRNVKTRLKQYIIYDNFCDEMCQKCFETILDKIFNTFIQGFLREVKLSLRMKQKAKRDGKRNRKAVRMNLPR